jgi:REP element-mobilizing transposase RayT
LAPVSHPQFENTDFLLLPAPPQLSPAEEFPHLRKRYWGQRLRARGYFCATVGAGDEKTIMEYIENQKWDEEVDGFKITASVEPQVGLSRNRQAA